MSVVGIDFGNLSALIAQAGKGGVDVILNDSSNRQTATCVSFQGKQRFIGDSGAALQRTNIKNTISGMKLLVGRKYDEPEVQREIARNAFATERLPNGGVGIRIMYNDEEIVLSAEQVMAMMLVKLKEIAALANSGVQIGESVLAVPYWFSESQRRGMLAACEIAQLNCLKVINESTAIALSYGIYKSAKKLFSETEPMHVMFIDLGYSCYSVTIVDFVQEKLLVRSTVCDKHLGGRDFDDVIIEWLAADFEKKTRIDVRQNVKAVLKLQVAAEKAKKTLSPVGVNDANVSVECVANDIDLNCNFTKEEFSRIASGLVERLEAPIQQALADAGLQREQLSDVEIVGGSSRIGMIKKRLGEILGLDASAINYGLKTTMNSDEAVARGAALQCAMLSSKIKVKPFSIIDKVNYPVAARFDTAGVSATSVKAESKGGDDEDDEIAGTSSAGSEYVPLFEKGDDFPRSSRRITLKKNTDFSIAVSYTDAAAALLGPGQDRNLAQFTVKVPAGKPVNDVRVSFNLDKNGCIVITSAEMMEPIVESESKEPESKDAKDDSKDAKDAKDDKDAATPPAPPKKRFSKLPLAVEIKTFVLDRTSIKTALEVEASMANEDRQISETANRRNELESYIYSMRDKLVGSLKPFSTETERNTLTTQLAENEDWLYGEGFDGVKSQYVQKLEELRVIGDKLDSRYNESEHRPAAIDGLKKQIEMCRTFASNRDESHSHITDEERERVHSEAKVAEDWLFDMLGKQGDLDISLDPVLTCAAISAKRNTLFVATNPIMIKPKPKPAPAPAPAAEEKKAEEPPAEGSKDDAGNTSTADESKPADPEPMEM